MKPSRPFTLFLTALALGFAPGAAAATHKRPPPESDLAPIDARRASVELAQKLAKVEPIEAIDASSGQPQPFNPPGFGLTARPVVEAATPGPAHSMGDREVLAALAQRIQPQGTVIFGSQQLLSFGKRYLHPGDRLTVNYEGQDYNLELVNFDTINFTLRLNHEEITRPIKPGK